jgi:hypothetical protein
MPKPSKDFKGKAIISYGYCSKEGQYTEKDLDNVDIYDYCDYCDMENDDVEIVECEIISDQIIIDDDIYIYMEEDDVFMSINLDTRNIFVKVHFIHSCCESCGSDDYLVKYCFGNIWICNGCIIDNEII